MVISRLADGLTRGVETVTDVVTAPFSDTGDPARRDRPQPRRQDGLHHLAGRQPARPRADAAAARRRRGADPRGLAAAAAGRHDPALPLRGSPGRPDLGRAALARRHAADQRAAAVAEGAAERAAVRAVRGSRTVHLDIVDYPGEWLLDLGPAGRSPMPTGRPRPSPGSRRGPRAAAFRAALRRRSTARRRADDEAAMAVLADVFRAYLEAAREAGYSDLTPGRFLLPGRPRGLAGPDLRAAAARSDAPGRRSIWREFERRFESYKRTWSSRSSATISPGSTGRWCWSTCSARSMPGRARWRICGCAMADILGAFRPGRNAWLSSIFLGRRVERILFAATKADHLHHSQHPRLATIAQALLREAKDRADFSGARTEAMAIAALRTTVEETVTHDGPDARHGARAAGRYAAGRRRSIPASCRPIRGTCCRRRGRGRRPGSTPTTAR